MKKLFKKYALQNRAGANLENAIVELIAELERKQEADLRNAFKKGANAVITCRWQVSKSEVDNLADENGF